MDPSQVGVHRTEADPERSGGVGVGDRFLGEAQQAESGARLAARQLHSNAPSNRGEFWGH